MDLTHNGGLVLQNNGISWASYRSEFFNNNFVVVFSFCRPGNWSWERCSHVLLARWLLRVGNWDSNSDPLSESLWYTPRGPTLNNVNHLGEMVEINGKLKMLGTALWQNGWSHLRCQHTIRAPIWVVAIPLLNQFAANMPGRQCKMAPVLRPCTYIPTWGIQMEFQAGFGLALCLPLWSSGEWTSGWQVCDFLSFRPPFVNTTF